MYDGLNVPKSINIRNGLSQMVEVFRLVQNFFK